MAALMLVTALAAPAQAARYAGIVIDGHSGEVLYEEYADSKRYPASLTKMMTLYMLFEALETGRVSKSTRLKVSSHAARQPASRLGLGAGQTISVDDAIQALVIRSANDVAVVVAEALGKTEAGFARMMTQRARELGMSRTTFANASGLPNRKQMSTARDMAKLAQALYFSFPHHYHYFGETSFRFGGRTYGTHNRLVKTYRGADGLKTGYIRAAGYNLVTSAERNGRRLIGVVFGGKSSRSRDAQMVKMLDRAWPKLSDPVIALPQIKPAPTMVVQAFARTIEAPATVSAPVVAAVSEPLPAMKPEVEMESLAMGDADPSIFIPAVKPRDEALVAAAAPEVVAPAPRRAPSGSWAIQVGAYYQRDSAEKAVQRATDKLDRAVLAKTEPAIVLLEGRKKPIYRARLVGLSRSEANEACRDLKRADIACLAVKHEADAVIAMAR